MSITVPHAPIAVQLTSTSADTPIVVRAHTRKRTTSRYTRRMAAEDGMRRHDEVRAASNALFDEMCEALSTARDAGIVLTHYRSRFAFLAITGR